MSELLSPSRARMMKSGVRIDWNGNHSASRWISTKSGVLEGKAVAGEAVAASTLTTTVRATVPIDTRRN